MVDAKGFSELVSAIVVQAAIDFARENQCEAFVSVGGGSVSARQDRAYLLKRRRS